MKLIITTKTKQFKGNSSKLIMTNNFFEKLFQKLKLLIDFKNSRILFSQTGEDAFLREVFLNKKNGFYVDVGAHHPTRYSNTFIFYSKGWKGINIEPDPSSINLFKKKRPRDINLQKAVSNKSGSMTFYRCEDNAYSTLSKKEAKKYEKIGKVKKIKVKVDKLSNILDKNLPKNTHIDFLSVDTEGNDLKVLKSNNWKKYSPEFLLVEMMGMPENNSEAKKIYSFLKKQNYTFVGKTVLTGIFRLNKEK